MTDFDIGQLVEWIAVIISLLAFYWQFAKQQGKTQTSLENVIAKLNDVSRSVGSLERRVSYLEGKINALCNSNKYSNKERGGG